MFRLGTSRPARRRPASSSPGIEISELDGVRALHIDSSTVQSAMRVNAPFDLELTYSRGIMTFLLFKPEVREVLVIGLGGGSIPKFIHHYLPQMRTRVVEINPEVISVARSHFMLPPDDERLEIIEDDGAAYLQRRPDSPGLLILDVFDGQGVPPELYSQAFFDSCAEALKTDGMLAVNLWGSDRNFDIYLARIEQC
ncbi:spermidine synthase [mine drainage metagenome]|uniref:Spermidine synthase n=1 Tax=mine drainage metagenome TaxID=410659 RepID=A0A1J5QIU4_9ZZZZ